MIEVKLFINASSYMHDVMIAHVHDVDLNSRPNASIRIPTPTNLTTGPASLDDENVLALASAGLNDEI